MTTARFGINPHLVAALSRVNGQQPKDYLVGCIRSVIATHDTLWPTDHGQIVELVGEEMSPPPANGDETWCLMRISLEDAERAHLDHLATLHSITTGQVLERALHRYLSVTPHS